MLLSQRNGGFSCLVDAVTDFAIYMLDPDGSIASWNWGAERISGYRADEVIGQNYSLFFTREDRRVGTPADMLNRVRKHGQVNPKDGANARMAAASGLLR